MLCELDDEEQMGKAKRQKTCQSHELMSHDMQRHTNISNVNKDVLQVLNLLLYKLTRRPYDDMLLGFLFVDEHLVDIGDDLVDYEARRHVVSDDAVLFHAVTSIKLQNVCSLQDDVIANSFNIYRGAEPCCISGWTQPLS